MRPVDICRMPFAGVGNFSVFGKVYRRFRFRRPLTVLIVAMAMGTAALISARPLVAQSHVAVSDNRAVASPIVVGFLGGFVRADDRRHGEVPMAERLRAAYGDSVHVEVYENRNEAKAHDAILHWLDGNRDGKLSSEEKQNAHIILFGHSWGASAMLSLARELQAEDIPILLTIQLDTISRHGENDSLIPANVAEAINFYQSSGILHGQSRITAEDPSRTKILGNFRLQYDKEPDECRTYPWLARVLSKGHIALDCDPRLWSRVETLIRTRLQSVAQPH